MKITMLGTGTSHGVPMIACTCAVCRSTDPRDKRTRPSIALAFGGHTILIDTSPEMRLQLVAAGIMRVDAVLYTHTHADHIHGIDDLRRFSESRPSGVPVYGTASTLADIRVRFPYIFAHHGQFGGGLPSLDLHEITGPFTLYGQKFLPVHVLHGELPVLGFRVGTFAYVTDCSYIPPESKEALRNLDVLVLDALRRQPHPTHFSLDQAIAVAQELQPRRTYLTHLTHDISHAEISAILPPGISLAYDGLQYLPTRARCTRMDDGLTHIGEHGRARMVDVGAKAETAREAWAEGRVRVAPATLALIASGGMAKGDVLAVAQVAGIMGAKSTPSIVPLCHPLPLSGVDLRFRLDDELSAVAITAIVRTTGRTGVEMEALTAVTVAALTIYDMCKAVDKTMIIDGIQVTYKAGGRSGTIDRR